MTTKLSTLRQSQMRESDPGRQRIIGMNNTPRKINTPAMSAKLVRKSGKRRITPAPENAYAASTTSSAAMTTQLTGARKLPTRAISTNPLGAPKNAYQSGPPNRIAMCSTDPAHAANPVMIK